MSKRKFLSLVLLIVLLLTSCTSKSEVSVEKCIVGTWQLAGNEAFARALLPPGSFDQETLSFVDAGGVVGYSFDEQGKVFVDVIAWMSQLSVQVDEQSYPLDINMIGEASGSYSLAGDQLSVTAVDHSNLAFEAFLDGMAMMRSLKVDEFAPLFNAAYSLAQIECNETTLRLSIIDQPGISQPIEFTRVTEKQE
ncbi:MAG TPA: hypothetical protein VLM80_11555 [Anaerolineales bacterium]|nr:hypothetical protein [Anaerolineales bacterium]